MYFKISFIVVFLAYNLSGIQASFTLSMTYTTKDKSTTGKFSENEVQKVSADTDKKYRFVFRDSIYEEGFKPHKILDLTLGNSGKWDISFKLDQGSAVKLIKPRTKLMFYISFVNGDVTDGYASFVHEDKKFLVVPDVKPCVVFEAESA